MANSDSYSFTISYLSSVPSLNCNRQLLEEVARSTWLTRFRDTHLPSALVKESKVEEPLLPKTQSNN